MMDVFAKLFATGHIIDLILALMALEAVALLVFNRMTGKGVGPRALLPFIAAGACLMLSLRVALTDGNWQVIALLLMAAFVMHLLDIGLRWRN